MFALKSTGFILFFCFHYFWFAFNTKLIPGWFVFFCCLLGSSIFFCLFYRLFDFCFSYNCSCHYEIVTSFFFILLQRVHAGLTREASFLYLCWFLKYFASAWFFYIRKKLLCELWTLHFFSWKSVVTVKIPCFYLQFFSFIV